LDRVEVIKLPASSPATNGGSGLSHSQMATLSIPSFSSGGGGGDMMGDDAPLNLSMKPSPAQSTPLPASDNRSCEHNAC
jgi:hypothetical protein